MTFANPVPLWALIPIAVGIGVVAWLAYRDAPLLSSRRATLTALRAIALGALVIFLMRPVAHSLDADARDAIVAVLVDTSRSMGIADAGGDPRIERARTLVHDDLLPAIGSQFQTELLRFGEHVASARENTLAATDRRTNLARALRDVREQYHGRAIAGIVLLTDGGDTGSDDAAAAAAGGPPVYAIGVGSTHPGRDREVVSVTAADPVLSDALVDVSASVVSRGFARDPVTVRLLENGREIDARRVAPAADGVPVREVFRVAPKRNAPTVYTIEIPVASDEIVPENNTRSVLVPAAAPPRRVLLVEGAPGFEHSFLRRALEADPGLDVDAVVRKGADETGAQTYYVQAARARAASLTGGFPATKDALFGYDVLLLGNLASSLLSRAQLEMTRAFVAERGGGLLVFGAQSFQRQTAVDLPIADVLPLDIVDRSNGVLQASSTPPSNRLALTAAGETHPLMQLAATPEENEKRWAAVPPLASVASLGAARPGASVLAVTGGPGGGARALVAVQRFGEGRSLIFTGEASWRWRMMLPASDDTYDRFWRQAVRWLGQTARPAVSIEVPTVVAPGDDAVVTIAARDASFAPQPNAVVDVRVTRPGGAVDTIRAEPDSTRNGTFRATIRDADPGVYRLTADARAGSTLLGSASAALLAGGADVEMADPRQNDSALQRVAAASGGAVIEPDAIGSLVDRLRAGAPAAALTVRRDLWHTGWSFAAILSLLAAEWILRRRWGLR